MLILLQSFSKVWIFISFKTNQDHIAKVLCINRNKPEVRCNGKCVLKRWTKAAEDKENKGTPQKLKEQKEVFYCLDKFNWQIECTIEGATEQKKTFSLQTPSTPAFVKGIFRPPKFVAVQMT